MKRLLLVAALLAVSPFTEAAVKKCVDKQGKVTYTDRPCATDTQQSEVAIEPPRPSQLPQTSRPGNQDRAVLYSRETDYENSKEHLCDVAQRERTDKSLRACAAASGFKATSRWIQLSHHVEHDQTLRIGVKCIGLEKHLNLQNGVPTTHGRPAHPPGRFADGAVAGPDFATWEEAAEILCGNRAQAPQPGSREERMRGAELVDAMCGGRDADVMLMLQQGVSPNGRSYEHDFSALHCAAIRGNVNLIRRLHERGASLGAIATDFAVKPIHMAAASGNIEAVKTLKTLGSSIDSTSLAGTPVMLAFNSYRSMIPSDLREQISREVLRKLREDRGSGVELMKAFIALGARTDGVNEQGQTLLHLAIQENDPELVKLLLARKLNPDHRDAFGRPALHLAVFQIESSRHGPPNESSNRKRSMTLALLEHGANINIRDEYGATVQCNASKDSAFLMELFKRGLDPNTTDNFGKSCWNVEQLTAAEIAAYFDALPVLRTPRRPDNSIGAGPLFAAAYQNNPDAVRYFLKRGLKPIDVGPNRYSILHGVASTDGGYGNHAERRREIVKLLRAAGAPMSEYNEFGETPLMAARIHDEAFIVFLIEQGADVNSINKRGASVLAQYEGYGNKAAVVAALKSRGAKSIKGSR